MANRKPTVAVRFNWPEDVHSRVRKFQAEQALKGLKLTFEQASIEFIRVAKWK